MTFFSPKSLIAISFVSPSGGSGVFYAGGFYDFPSTDANLTQASPTQTHGTANIAYAARAAVVCGGAGTTDGSDLVLTVTGTSVDDQGNETVGDSEVLIADCTAVATDEYYQTTKSWTGTITFTLSSTGGTTFSFDCNYGLSKFERFGNREFHVREIDVNGRAGANDPGFDIELLHHKDTGWTYAATGFVPGDGAIAQWSSDYPTNGDLAVDENFAWKRVDLDTVIAGNDGEGILFRVTTSANKAVESSTLGVIVDVHSWVV